MTTASSNAKGISFLILALLIISIQSIAGKGEISDAHPSVAFLFRDWTLPTLLDGIIMGGLGLVWAGWMYFMARAYSAAPASVIAPFEYLSLPISVMWGFVIWREIPTLMTLAGALLTLSSGMYILYRERK